MDLFFSWYHVHLAEPDRESLLRAAFAKDLKGPEFDAWIDGEAFTGVLAVGPLFALFYGVLIGPILGALFAAAATGDVLARSGAVIGLLLAPPCISLVAALTCFFAMPSMRTNHPRRWLLLVSPLLAVGAVWHCMTTIATSKNSDF